VSRLHPGVLAIDAEAECDRIVQRLKGALRDLKRRGLVVGISGGVDSAVCAALAARAVGPRRVMGLLLPERDGAPEARARARVFVTRLGIDSEERDITATLEAIGCYHQRDAALRQAYPDYRPGMRHKIVIAGGLDGRYNSVQLIVERAGPGGACASVALGASHFLQIVAATNFKQRVRKTVEYFHADRLNFAVVGTPNRLEFDQGFFVKNGDGSADVKPIAHLYKTQVYALARALDLPFDIYDASPTTDTFSLAQGQDEFYFGLPYDQMDHALWARNHGVPPEDLAAFLGLTTERAERIYRTIDTKRVTTRYLHRRPVLVGDVHEVHE
jgi:NAD+ synthase